MANSNLKYQGTDLDSLLIPKSAVWQPGERQQIYQWGTGSYGVTAYSVPSTVGSVATWSKIETTDTGARFGLKSDGTLWAWGKNDNGILGLGDLTHRSVPVQISGTWSDINAGSDNVAAILSNGTLWAWGKNYINSNMTAILPSGGKNVSSPVSIGALTTWSKVFVGYQTFFAIKTDGSLWSWGRADLGQIGWGYTGNQISYISPTQIGSGKTWSTVGAGLDVSHAIASDGTLWACGKGYDTGSGSNETIYSTLTQLGSLNTWSKTSGKYHNGKWLIKTDGTLWRIGYAPGWANATTLTQVGAETTWSLVKCGAYNCHAIKTNGTLWGWGTNASYALGLGTTTSPNATPTQIGTGTTWISVGDGNRNGSAGLLGV